ncbi:uncharacterized protein LOC114881473 [Osmia bicornis bicornis]|uniref:uncharacterized protein LOC114881473 n=1 Tax=Osmia bicornis bicornis TaxID=1437191 RepID=UPI001EAF5D9C|nr:uncharacterized protein LOC114881473 [Osmia bicornis bicornis]
MREIMILILLIPSLISATSYSNTPLSDSSGIFYQKLGIAKISNTELHLVTHINITYLSQLKALLENYLTRSQKLCNLMLNRTENSNSEHFRCEQTLQSVRSELKNIENKGEILNALTGISHENRKRRGLINGASYILNWLIGTPDADDAQYYSESIKSLLNDNRQTQVLLKSQIQVVTSTIKNFNNSIQSLKQTEDIMNSNMKAINKYMVKTGNLISDLSIQSVILQQVSTLLSLCTQISDYYNKYIEAINLSNHNIISPFIITPKDFCEELTKYSGEFELVITPNYKNIQKIYKLVKLQNIMMNDLVVFIVKIPLVRRTTFDLYHLIPLPIQHENNSIFSFIIPRKPYLLLSQSKSHYTLLSELKDCNQYLEGKYVCTDIHTAKTTEDSTCEVLLLTSHMDHLPRDCSTKTIHAEVETWKYVSNNQWLYVLQHPTTLTIICGEDKDHMEDIVLQKTGMLQLHNNCKGYTMLFSLEPTSQVNRNVTHLVPRMNIISSDCCISAPDYVKQDTPTALKPIKLVNIDLNDLKYNNKKLNEFDEMLTQRLKEPFIVTHTSWYTIILCVIGAILFLIICGNCCHWLGCWRLLKRLCCFTRSPNTGEIIPPVIKNFVNCTFDSSDHTEHREHSTEMVVYERHGEIQVSTEPTMDQHQLQLTPLSTRRYNLRSKNVPRSRKSTTPL